MSARTGDPLKTVVPKSYMESRRTGTQLGGANRQQSSVGFVCVEFYGPVNPMGSCRARSVYLTTRLLGRLSPLSV